MTAEQKNAILKKQLDGWERAKEAGRKGNPYATLCLHCYARHSPPMDDICPHPEYKAAPKQRES